MLATTLAASSTWSPPAKIRTVLSDVDGTLFPFGTSNPLSAGNVATLTEAMRRGVHVGLATGRIPGLWSEAIHAALPGLGASVYGNGGLVVDADGQVVFEASLPAEAAERVRQYTLGGRTADGDKKRLAVLAATRWQAAGQYSHHYVELAPEGETFCTRLIRNAAEPAILVPEFPAELPRIVKYVIFTNPDDDAWAPMPETVASLRRVLDGTGAVVLDCGPKQCEVFAPGVNKGSGVARLLEHLQVPASEAMALGDAENDVEMLRLVGAGVAMGNANDKARAAADVIVGTSDQDGVAEAVKRFVFGEEEEQQH